MALHIICGDGPPDAITPLEKAQHYIDETNGDAYLSVGISSPADWVLTGGVGSSFTTFESLLDTPPIGNLAANPSTTVRVNSAGNALEYSNQPLEASPDVLITSKQDNQILAWDTENNGWQNEFRVDWQDTWLQQSYEPFQMVRDQEWTMISNKSTSDRAAPEQEAPSVFGLPEIPTWQDNTAVDDIYYSGHRYFVGQLSIVDGARVWRPSADPDLQLTLRVSDTTDINNPISLVTVVIGAGAIGWVDVTWATQFFQQGQTVDFEVEGQRGATNQVPWVSIPNFWFGVSPWTGLTVKGFNNETQQLPSDYTLTDNAMGVDIRGNALTASDDWDIVAYSGAAGGTGAGGGGAQFFTDLDDTPSNYIGSALYIVRVNAVSNGLEFVDINTLPNNVRTFNARTGDVLPQAGDYTAADVGAYTTAETDTEIATAILEHLSQVDPHKQYLTVDTFATNIPNILTVQQTSGLPDGTFGPWNDFILTPGTDPNVSTDLVVTSTSQGSPDFFYQAISSALTRRYTFDDSPLITQLDIESDSQDAILLIEYGITTDGQEVNLTPFGQGVIGPLNVGRFVYSIRTNVPPAIVEAGLRIYGRIFAYRPTGAGPAPNVKIWKQGNTGDPEIDYVSQATVGVNEAQLPAGGNAQEIIVKNSVDQNDASWYSDLLIDPGTKITLQTNTVANTNTNINVDPYPSGTGAFIGQGAVPTAGTAGQVLTKVDGNNYNYAWVDNATTDENVKVSAADTTPGFLDPKIAVGTGIVKAILNPGANEQLQLSVNGLLTDETVKVSANDTTSGFLNGKLVAGTGITLTENNDGVNETLSVLLSGQSIPTGSLIYQTLTNTAVNTPAWTSVLQVGDTESVVTVNGALWTGGTPAAPNSSGTFNGGFFETQSTTTYIGTTTDISGNSSSNSIFIGGSGNATMTGNNQVFIGGGAGINSTDGSENTLIGFNAGQSITTGSFNIYIGDRSGQNSVDAGTNLSIGSLAMQDNVSSSNNVALGRSALRRLLTGENNVAVGQSAGNSVTDSSESVLIGSQAGSTKDSCTKSSYIGREAGRYGANDTNNTGIGYQSLRLNSASVANNSNNTGVGYRAGAAADVSNCVYIGYQAGDGNTVEGRLMIHNTSTDTPLLDGDFANSELTINGSLEVTTTINDAYIRFEPASSNYTFKNTTDIVGGVNNIVIGDGGTLMETGAQQNVLIGAVLNAQALTTGDFNFFMGNSSGRFMETGSSNVGLGVNTLRDNVSGSNNLAIGTSAMIFVSAGSSNVAVGTNALDSQQTSVIGLFRSIGIGQSALRYGSETYDCVAIGTNALSTTASTFAFRNNVAIGGNCGLNSEVTNCVYIGFSVAQNETTNNTLKIHNANTSTPLLDGDFANSALTINGTLNSTLWGSVPDPTLNEGLGVPEDGWILTVQPGSANGKDYQWEPNSSGVSWSSSFTIADTARTRTWVFVGTANNQIVTLPTVGSTAGATDSTHYMLNNSDNRSHTVAAQGADSIVGSTTLSPGDQVSYTSDGVNTWTATLINSASATEAAAKLDKAFGATVEDAPDTPTTQEGAPIGFNKVSNSFEIIPLTERVKQDSATTTENVTSNTFTSVSQTVLTLTPGTWLVQFSAWGKNNVGNQESEYGIFASNVLKPESRRELGFDMDNASADMHLTLHTQALVSVSTTTIVDVKAKTSANTFIMGERSIIATRI